MITDKKHQEIIKKLTDDFNAEIKELLKQLEEARNLKEILLKLSGISINGKGFDLTGGCWDTEMKFSDDIAQYVDDYFGGKVIKQEATKVIVITGEGKTETGFTRQNPDTGYKTKLVRKDLK